MKIIFATSNENKVKEVKEILPKHIAIVSLKEMGYTEDIEETGSTLEENSLLKAQTIFDKYKLPVLAEDTGLEVDALNGEPGVYSARYAGEKSDDKANNAKLLQQLEAIVDEKRQAAFHCAMALAWPDGRCETYDGQVSGLIMKIDQINNR